MVVAGCFEKLILLRLEGLQIWMECRAAQSTESSGVHYSISNDPSPIRSWKWKIWDNGPWSSCSKENPQKSERFQKIWTPSFGNGFFAEKNWWNICKKSLLCLSSWMYRHWRVSEERGGRNIWIAQQHSRSQADRTKLRENIQTCRKFDLWWTKFWLNPSF